MTYFKNIVIVFSLLFTFANDLKANKNYKQLLSEESRKHFNLALKEGNKKKWARSLNHLSKIKNETAKKMIIWRWLIAEDGLDLGQLSLVLKVVQLCS